MPDRSSELRPDDERELAAAVDSDASSRSAEDRVADHARIDRLASDLLPALVARLAATGLGELEVREGAWKVRLRRPAHAAPGPSTARRPATDRPSRAQPGHEGHGHAPGALEGHRSARSAYGSHSTNGSGPGAPAPVGPGHGAGAEPPSGRDPHRAVATSPAVGIYQPRPQSKPGTRVRAGDRLGTVDMLGIPQEVVAPADGIVGATLVESGDAVEYGQELVEVELVTPVAGHGDG